jgi:hypothetical protein
MNNTWRFVSVGLIVGSAVLAGAAYLSEPALTTGVTLEPSTYQFGKVHPGSVECDYTLTNRFPYQIEILGAVKTCGCTVASVPTGPLKPGKAVKMHSVFDLRGRSGEFATSISVLFRRAGTGNEGASAVTCVASALVEPTIRADPGHLEFRRGIAAEAMVRLSGLTGDARAVSCSVNHGAFKASQVGNSGEFTVSFDPSLWKQDVGFATLVITTTSKEEPEVTVPISVSLPSGK